MKVAHLLIAGVVLAAAFVVAPARAGDDGTQRFGAKITAKQPVDIAALAATPEKFKGKVVRLEGTVKEVCQGRGCWVEVADAKGASFLARSLDEKVLVPKDCKGRKVVVQGKVTTLPSKVKAEQAEGHACPKPEWVVATQGIELMAAEAETK